MKKSILFVLLYVFVVLNFNCFAQTPKAEVLYFKANLPCCQGKACNLLEADVRSVVQKLYPNSEVEFRVIRLADETNKPLIDKFNAKSQTVVIVGKNKKGEKSMDISDIVRNYNMNKNMAEFESAMKNKFAEFFK